MINELSFIRTFFFTNEQTLFQVRCIVDYATNMQHECDCTIPKCGCGSYSGGSSGSSGTTTTAAPTTTTTTMPGGGNANTQCLAKGTKNR